VTQREGPGGPVVAGATSGLVVGYSPEYGPQSGEGLTILERARQLTDGFELDPTRPEDAFSHDLPAATVQTPLWPWLVLLALLLLPFDVAIRRLNLGRRELAAVRSAILDGRRQPAAGSSEPAGHRTTATLRAGIRQTRAGFSRSHNPRDATSTPAAEPTRARTDAIAPPEPLAGSDTAEPTGSTARSDLLSAKRRATQRGRTGGESSERGTG
jgi:hypothetical protein